MLAILSVVLPVFLVIGAGWAAARWRAFPDSGIDALLTFVIRFATPCLLFAAMYDLSLSDAFDWGMLAAFYGSAAICFTTGYAMGRIGGRRPGEAVAIAFAGYFSNTVLIGLPIMLRAYGEAATQPAYAIIAFHAPVLYSLGMVAMEVARRDGTGALPALKRAGRSILTNALMIGLAAGLFCNLAEIRLPTPVEDSIRLLAGATLPTALFALGAALTRYGLQAQLGWAAAVSFITLLLQPGVAWLIAVPVLDVPAEFARAAVIIAAMPAGLNVYVFAAMYKRAEPIAAGAVLMSTAFSVATISFWLIVMGGAGVG